MSTNRKFGNSVELTPFFKWVEKTLMSFKKISCMAVMAALVASPVLAQATLSLELKRDGGGIIELDPTTGGFQWDLMVEMTNAGAVGIEAALDFGAGNLLGGSANTTDFDFDNPGNQVFAWEAAIAETDGYVEGYHEDLAAGQSTVNVGSINFLSPGIYTVASFITSGPNASVASSLSPTASLLGAYDGSGNVVGMGGTHAFAGTGDTVPDNKTFTADSDSSNGPIIGGDADLDGDVDFTDFLAFSPNYDNPGSYTWNDGDFDNDGDVDFTDFLFFSPNFDNFNGNPAPGPVAVGAAPEPSAILLASLLVCSAGVLSRRG